MRARALWKPWALRVTTLILPLRPSVRPLLRLMVPRPRNEPLFVQARTTGEQAKHEVLGQPRRDAEETSGICIAGICPKPLPH